MKSTAAVPAAARKRSAAELKASRRNALLGTGKADASADAADIDIVVDSAVAAGEAACVLRRATSDCGLEPLEVEGVAARGKRRVFLRRELDAAEALGTRGTPTVAAALVAAATKAGTVPLAVAVAWCSQV